MTGASRRLLTKGQGEEVRLRYALHREFLVVPKAESPIERRFAERNTAPRATLLQRREPALNQRSADTLALEFRHRRNGSEPVPVLRTIADLNRRERNMADDLPVFLCHERDRQRVAAAQRIDDEVLGRLP